MHYHFVTFGSATVDNYVIVKNQKKYVLKDRKMPEGWALHFPLGSKIEVERVCVYSGGGGTNTAATFARQGFKTAYIGKVGKDKRGESVIDELQEIGVETRFIAKAPSYSTAYSLIFPFSGERTIFVCRGASRFLNKKEIPWQQIKNADWFYIAPLSGAMAKDTELIIDFARRHKIKVALNPGSSQLALLRSSVKRVLAKTDFLILNREEAALLTGIPSRQELRTIKHICSMVKGIVVVTKSGEGALAADGKHLYSFGKSSCQALDKTGAGDSFGAGFVSGMQKGMGITEAMQLAAANARSCIKMQGAKVGLLRKGQQYPKIKIIKKLL